MAYINGGNSKTECLISKSLMKDYYEILGIEYLSTHEEIKKAFRELVKKYHPDKNIEPSDEKIKNIIEAYKVLSDNDRRKGYDIKYSENFNKNQENYENNNSEKTTSQEDIEDKFEEEYKENDFRMKDNSKENTKYKIKNLRFYILISSILLFLIIIWRPLNEYVGKYEKAKNEKNLILRINQTKKFNPKYFSILNANINLKTRWSENKIYYILQVELKNNESDSTAKILNRNKLYNLNSMDINFLDKDGFKIQTIQIQNGDFVHIKNKQNQLIGLEVNKSLSFDKLIYSKVYDFSIAYTGF